MPVTAKRWSKALAATLLISSLSLSVAASEYRCGWLENPTPSNYWLNDKDGSWTIISQGGYSVGDDSIDNLPEVNDDEFVKTNGYYGYSCACLSVTTDKSTQRIVSIDTKGKQVLLKTCLEDAALDAKKSTVSVPESATVVSTASVTAAAASPLDQLPHLIQIFSTYDENKANAMRKALNQSIYPTIVKQGKYQGKTIYRVRVGPFPNKQASIDKQNQLKRLFKGNYSIQNSIVIQEGSW